MVDVPLKNCLLLTGPFFVVLAGVGFVTGSLSAMALPAAALLSWSLLYTYLWTHMHRAIHGTKANWFRRCGPVFRFFRDHHLQHHAHAGVNFGTVFPWTDYLFFTWHGWRAARQAQGRRTRNDNAAERSLAPSGAGPMARLGATHNSISESTGRPCASETP
jgi:hypothetical protein